jgi:hypothetical protein
VRRETTERLRGDHASVQIPPHAVQEQAPELLLAADASVTVSRRERVHVLPGSSQSTRERLLGERGAVEGEFPRIDRLHRRVRVEERGSRVEEDGAGISDFGIRISDLPL